MALNIKEPITEINIISVKEHNVSRINSIKEEYKSIRQAAKAPTFALT